MSQAVTLARRWNRQLGAGLVLATAVVMLAWTWGTWPDVVVDFGREVYLPWRLSEGDVLYRDAIHFNGPLSPYFNSLLFRCFGVSLRTLVICNLMLTVAVAYMLHHILLRVAGRAASTTGGIVFFTLFAFPQFLWVGNFNFVCPYSHELTHGMTIILAGILLLERQAHRPRRIHALLAGMLLGLAFLTKVEVFLAALAATAIGWAALMWIGRASSGRVVQSAMMMLIGALLPPFAAWMLLQQVLPAREALNGVLGAWPWVLTTNAPNMRFFRNMSGLIDPATNIGRMLAAVGVYAVLFFAAAAVDLRVRTPGRRRVAAIAMFLCVMAVLMWPTIDVAVHNKPVVAVLESAPWADAFRPLPLLCMAVMTAAIRRLRRNAGDETIPSVLALAFATAALMLLLKMALSAHVYAYGFVHALLATLLWVALLTTWVPDWARRRGAGGGIVMSAGAGVMMAAIATHLYVNAYFMRVKTDAVADGSDTFFADPRGEIMRKCVDELRRAARPGDALAVFPEGLLLNYLSRLPLSQPYYTYIPPQFEMYGEPAMLRAIQERPPRWVAIVQRFTHEYGQSTFGIDYAQQLFQWLRQEYVPYRTIGPAPFSTPYFGILLLEHRPRQDVLKSKG